MTEQKETYYTRPTFEKVRQQLRRMREQLAEHDAKREEILASIEMAEQWLIAHTEPKGETK